MSQAITSIKDALAQDELCSSQGLVSVYGYCPDCGAKGLQRERRPDGFDRCVNGHIYPSSKATPPKEQQSCDKRPWVGLTDAEWMNIVNKDKAWFGQRPDEVANEVAKLVEAKLKEKNT